MWIEERIALGHVDMRIISPRLGTAIAEKLREAGHAVTEVPARGRDGMVTLLMVSIRRRKIQEVMRLAQEVDQEAFITAEEVQRVRRGFWR